MKTPNNLVQSHDIEYYYSIYITHLSLLNNAISCGIPNVVAEIGPGASFASGITALLTGSNTVYFLDVVRHVAGDNQSDVVYKIANLLRERKAPFNADHFPPFKYALNNKLFPEFLTDEVIDNALSPSRVDEIIKAVKGEISETIKIAYIAPWQSVYIDGIYGEIDFLFSHSVMEHVANVEDAYAKFNLLLRSNGAMSHSIDLKSHNFHSKENGHFSLPETKWSELAKSSYSLNRLSVLEHQNIIERNRFSIVMSLRRKIQSSILRSELAPEFKNLSESDFLCGSLFVQAVKKGGGSPLVLSKELTLSDIRSAYKVFLGRLPESAEIIEKHLKNSNYISERFSAILLSSEEFYIANSRTLARKIISDATVASVANIEIDVSTEKLDALFEHVQSVWTKLGVEEPHYSVLSGARFKPENISRNLKEFYQSGHAEVDIALSRLHSCGVKINDSACALELGCGVGRVTRALAGKFASVHGYDISINHLQQARDYIKAAELDNVKFYHIESLKDCVFEPFDFFYSKIVLQHNPPPVQAFILEKIFSSAKNGSIFIFQLMTARKGYTFNVSSYLNEMNRLENQELHVLPQPAVFQIMAKHSVTPVEVFRDTALTGFDRVSSCFIARKAHNNI